MTEARLDAPRKRASISDVATQAGVSRAAVSKVIRNAYGVSPAMRERVHTAIEQLDYRPRVSARAMRGSSFTIGFEIPHLGNDFFTQVMQGATEALHDSQYQLIIAPGVESARGSGVIEALIDRQVDGVVAISSEIPVDQLGRLAAQVPMVVLGRHDDSPAYDTVTGDDAAGVEMALDHLFELGHTRIAHITIKPSSPWTPQFRRCAVYRELMTRAGLDAQVSFTESNEAAAYHVARELLLSPEAPTAIFAAHDVLAVGVLRAVADRPHGAPPIAIVGYDGIDLAAHPLISLTTVDQQGAEMGATAVRLLLEQVRGERTAPRAVQLTPKLRIRRSTSVVSL